MNPFYFGARQRRLFGIYEPAVPGSSGERAAVLCHPWGAEYVHAHRTMRRLAIKLSAAGFHTLQFDYFGTGDSAGEMTDADLDGWENDVESAMEELKDIAGVGVAQVALVGLRVGAAIAAKVAARRPEEVNALALWDPVVSGGAYLQSLRAAHQPKECRIDLMSAESERLLQQDVTEIQGFPLTARMARDLEAIDLGAAIPATPARTLIIISEQTSSHDALRSTLAGRAAGSLAIEHVANVCPWLEDHAGKGAMPADVIQRIVEYLR